MISPAGTGGNTRRMLSNGTCMWCTRVHVSKQDYVYLIKRFIIDYVTWIGNISREHIYRHRKLVDTPC